MVACVALLCVFSTCLCKFLFILCICIFNCLLGPILMCVLTPTLCPVLFCLFPVKLRWWFVSFMWLLFPSSSLVPFKHFDKFNPFFGGACWRVWHRQKLLSCRVAQKGSVVTNLTVWLNSWVVCWLFVCHLTRWQTDWLSALLTEWLAGCKSDWLTVRLESLTGCLAGRVTGHGVVTL